MMTGYTKIFSSLLDSTIWQEDKETRLVWITMLVMKDRDQQVMSSVPGLAKRAGVTVDECVAALETLRAPDPWSRTKDHEGRRIEELDGGWLILNGAKYRGMMSKEDRRVYNREKKREERALKKAAAAAAAATSPAPGGAVDLHAPAPVRRRKDPGSAPARSVWE